MIIQTGMRTDIPAFCPKNPAPMLLHMDALQPYGQCWFVTITPYGKNVEPNVPDKEKVMKEIYGVDMEENGQRSKLISEILYLKVIDFDYSL